MVKVISLSKYQTGNMQCRMTLWTVPALTQVGSFKRILLVWDIVSFLVLT